MNIELKNFNQFAAGSEETEAFVATVYVDGTRMFTASNSGKGEENRCDPVTGKTYADIKIVADWIDTLPEVALDSCEGSLPDSLDFYISRLVHMEIIKRDLKRLLKRRVVLYDPQANHHQGELITLVAKFKPSLLNGFRKHIENSFKDCLILNDLPFDQAVAMYTVSNTPQKMAEIYQQIKAPAT